MRGFTLLSIFCLSIFYLISNSESRRSDTWRRQKEPVPYPPQQKCRSFGKDSTKNSFTLGILMYDTVEVLDFAGPFEVFAVTGQMYNRFRVVLVADKKNIIGMNGLKVTMDYVFWDRNMPQLDILLIPGSNTTGTLGALQNLANFKWIKSIEPRLDYIISVCTGAAILGKAGLADGLDITTHHQAFDFVSPYTPRSTLWRGRRFTDNGRVLTSAGISAGIDVSLYFVKRMFGREEVGGVVERMEYDWKDWNYDSCRGTYMESNTQPLNYTNNYRNKQFW